MHKCHKHGRKICTWCILTTISFPLEHFAWEKLPLLRNVTVLLGL